LERHLYADVELRDSADLKLVVGGGIELVGKIGTIGFTGELFCSEV
jgi:hypothetical protein